MSNLSLKEQLQALGVSSNSTSNKVETSSKLPKKKNSGTATSGKSKPAWLEQAQYGVELLKVYFPACFKEPKDVRPLKIGIKQDLVKSLAGRDDIVIPDKACMVNSLSYYVNSISYHKTVVEGAERIDLDGNPAGIITAEEARYSAECRKAKSQKKNHKAAPSQKVKETAST